MESIIDYSNEKLTFWQLEEREVKRQGAEKDRRLKNVLVRLSCDCCGKPFVRWLHDRSLAFSFCCSEKCLKEMERRALEEIEKEGKK